MIWKQTNNRNTCHIILFFKKSWDCRIQIKKLLVPIVSSRPFQTWTSSGCCAIKINYNRKNSIRFVSLGFGFDCDDLIAKHISLNPHSFKNWDNSMHNRNYRYICKLHVADSKKNLRIAIRHFPGHVDYTITWTACN